MSKPVVCVGIVCIKGTDLLLIKRGRAPRLGAWSIPGGRVDYGETLKDAALRELFEETGIKAHIASLIDVYEIIEEPYHYVLIDYLAYWYDGEPRAQDDADQAVFIHHQDAFNFLAHVDLKDVVTKALALHSQAG